MNADELERYEGLLSWLRWAIVELDEGRVPVAAVVSQLRDVVHSAELTKPTAEAKETETEQVRAYDKRHQRIPHGNAYQRAARDVERAAR